MEIELGSNGGLFAFADVQGLRNFINEQRDSAVGRALSQMSGPVWERFYEAQEALNRLDSGAIEIAELKRIWLNVFAEPNLYFPLADSELGLWIEEFERDHGLAAAGAAMSCYSGTQQNLNLSSPDYFLGALAYNTRRLGLNSSSVDIVERSNKALVKRFETQQKEFSDRAAKMLAERDDELASATDASLRLGMLQRARYRRTIRWVADRALRRAKNLQEQLASARDDIRTVEATYKTQLGLQAPVEYWLTKSKEHGRTRDFYKWALLTYAPLAVAFGWLAFSAFAFRLNQSTAVSAGTVVYGAMGILLTTVMLWTGRILVRLFMSEHHLAIDASERATMAHTFLALQLAGQLEAKDLQLILAPLFRPTSDGIIKDDAAPDIGLAGVASKLLGPR